VVAGIRYTAGGYKGRALAPGVDAEACGDGDLRVVEILKMEAFEDHWQALRPDCE
jgi:hypothetical protein